MENNIAIQHLYSNDEGSVPQLLLPGEIAINRTDEKIYFSNTEGHIVSIGGNNSPLDIIELDYLFYTETMPKAKEPNQLAFNRWSSKFFKSTDNLGWEIYNPNKEIEQLLQTLYVYENELYQLRRLGSNGMYEPTAMPILTNMFKYRNDSEVFALLNNSSNIYEGPDSFGNILVDYLFEDIIPNDGIGGHRKFSNFDIEPFDNYDIVINIIGGDSDIWFYESDCDGGSKYSENGSLMLAGSNGTMVLSPTIMSSQRFNTWPVRMHYVRDLHTVYLSIEKNYLSNLKKLVGIESEDNPEIRVCLIKNTSINGLSFKIGQIEEKINDIFNYLEI